MQYCAAENALLVFPQDGIYIEETKSTSILDDFKAKRDLDSELRQTAFGMSSNYACMTSSGRYIIMIDMCYTAINLRLSMKTFLRELSSVD